MSSSHPPSPRPQSTRRRTSERHFFWILGCISSSYIVLIVLMLGADLAFIDLEDFSRALRKPEIQAAFWLTIKSCTVAAIISVWVAAPLGYLLSRFRFPGDWIVDTIVDIPIVLPPLVLGLSLLILFHLPIYGWELEGWMRDRMNFPVTFHWPAVVLAQFSVGAAFAIRTMRVTFDQIDSRAEDVARTLGCSRMESFVGIALPQARYGLMTAFTIAWARALGEFGPILVFAGSTRFRTEVLSTTVFLELSIGHLSAAVAVSLLMVMMAVLILTILRILDMKLAG